MGKVIYFPGSEPSISHEDIIENMITSILKEVSDLFIDRRMEMGPMMHWYEEIREFIERRDIPHNASASSLVSALRDYKSFWREEALRRMDLFMR